jgi:hypothetical protein
VGRTAQASQNYHLPKNTLELGKSSKSIGTNLTRDFYMFLYSAVFSVLSLL